MANISESVCLNHPDTPAVCRCATCGKPVCSQCVVSRNGSSYCSEKCADDAANSVGRVNSTLDEKARSDAKRAVRAIVTVIILLAVAAAGYFLYRRNEKKVDSFIRKTENKVVSGAKDAKDSIQQGIPTSSSYKRSRENLVK